MRIFFIGTVKFSYDSLKVLLESGANIVGVATRSNVGRNADYADLKPLCEEYNVPFKIVNDINHQKNLEFVRGTNPDIIYCFGWSNLLKKDLLHIPARGVIGFHPARIPHNKGRHPIIWALCLGLNYTASTFFFMDEGADTGDILSQQDIQIEEADDACTLYKKITDIAISQIIEFTSSLELGTNNRIVQSKGGNSWRKRTSKDGEIDFRMSSRSIYNLVRALTYPYVGAHLVLKGNDYKVWKVNISDIGLPNEEPGKVLDSDGTSFIVKTGDGAVQIINHEVIELPKVGDYI